MSICYTYEVYPILVSSQYRLLIAVIIIIIINEYFNRIILQLYHTYTHIYTVISEVLHENYIKLKSRSIINNILKFKILKFKTLRSQKVNSQKRKSQRLIKGH